MNKILSILILGALPTLAFAAGDHAGGHDMAGMHKEKSGDTHASIEILDEVYARGGITDRKSVV